jgi:UDP-N-acetylglucosamine--N-acetylmuramyl-(pentapeptide) pyrophosphoryl-undecaprenol N-acetylglucosamine transferase
MTHTIFLVAGGTGGHVFPALALAEELIGMGYTVECITDKRGEKYFRQTVIAPHIVQSSAWATKFEDKVKAAWKILQGLVHSFEMCREYSPSCVVGFGGYPSFPMVKAAQLLKIPTILHEQNAVFGRANLSVAKMAKAIATTFPETKLLPPEYKGKTIVTGNPVRPVFVQNEKSYQAPTQDSAIHLLVFAGSQGSSLFSKILPEAIAKLGPTLKDRIMIKQQARLEDVDSIKQAYAEMNVKAAVQPFISDMLKAYQSAQLVIARAGASTVAEMTALGLPGIYVPLAASLDGDQAQNAQQIVANDAGWMIMEQDFTADTLAKKLTEVLSDPVRLNAAAQAAKQLGKTEAASNLARVITKVVR